MADCGFAADARPLIEETSRRLFAEYMKSRLMERPFDERTAAWEPEAELLGKALRRWHEPTLMGISTTGVAWNAPDATNILRWSTFEAMKRALRSGPPGPDFEGSAEAVSQELDDFLHATSLEVLVVAEVVGLQLPRDRLTPIEFESRPRVRLEPLTYELIEEFELGKIDRAGSFGRLVGACAVTVRSEMPVRMGAPAAALAVPEVNGFACALDVINALQVVHPYALGVPVLVQRPTKFTVAPGIVTWTHGDTPRLDAPNVLNVEAIDRCKAVYQGLRAKPHRSMRLACSRLGLSRLRLRPEDAILDAAIGLEAILLADSGKGELRYQFSLNYALLGSIADDRADRFRMAQRVYDIRSAIAHGGEPDPKHLKKIDPSASAHGVAKRCQEMLEECIEAFRADMAAPVFTKSEYWRHRAIGIPT